MATTNGALTPPTLPDAATSPNSVAGLKRKREDDEDKPRPASRNAQTQRDMLEILQQ
jgi:hypothetical protein